MGAGTSNGFFLDDDLPGETQKWVVFYSSYDIYIQFVIRVRVGCSTIGMM